MPTKQAHVFGCGPFVSRKEVFLNYNNNRQLLWCFFLAVMGFMLLYHLWFYIMGGLAIYGAIYLYREYLKNKRNR
ncbi:MAG: hypothetical protein ACK4UN_08045 [Limisphaerales bacterium]